MLQRCEDVLRGVGDVVGARGRDGHVRGLSVAS